MTHSNSYERYKKKYTYLEKRINNLESKNYFNRSLITNLKKQKLQLKDRMLTERRKESIRNLHLVRAIG